MKMSFCIFKSLYSLLWYGCQTGEITEIICRHFLKWSFRRHFNVCRLHFARNFCRMHEKLFLILCMLGIFECAKYEWQQRIQLNYYEYDLPSSHPSYLWPSIVTSKLLMTFHRHIQVTYDLPSSHPSYLWPSIVTSKLLMTFHRHILKLLLTIYRHLNYFSPSILTFKLLFTFYRHIATIP